MQKPTESLPKELPEQSFFRVPRMVLRFFGIWPMDTRLPVFFYFNFLTLLMAVITESIYGFLHISNIKLTLDALCPSATQGVSWLKMLIVYLNRERFRALLLRIHKLYKEERRPGCIKLYLKGVKYGHIGSSLVFFFAGATAWIYILRPIASNIHQYYSGKPIVRELPFRAAFPFDVYANPLYAIFYFFLSHGGICTITGLTGMDGMFLTLCCHIAVQFDAMQNEIDSLIENEIAPEDSTRQLTVSENQKLCKRLSQLIFKQYELFDLFDSVLDNFTVIILMHFVTAATVLGLASINLVMARGFETLLYINYNCAVLSQLFIFAAGGTRITESSYSVADAVYGIQWERCNVNVRRMIVLIILRSHRGTRVVVPFFEVSLPAYCTILGTAGSYIALLKTFL